MHLSCGPCELRSWCGDDLDDLVRHADNPNVARQLRDRFPSPYTREAGQAWLALAASMRPESSFAIVAGGALVGGIGLHLGTDIERVSAEVGYWLGESAWGRGLATAALKAFTGYAFETFGLTRIFAVPFAENRASCRVLEKAGFALV